MATAFQSNAFQNNAFQNDEVAIVADLDALESGDSLQSGATATVSETFLGGSISRPMRLPFKFPRRPTIHGDLVVKERGDSCSSIATLGPNPVDMDNDLLLVAA
jgi:hypothetical protein